MKSRAALVAGALVVATTVLVLVAGGPAAALSRRAETDAGTWSNNNGNGQVMVQVDFTQGTANFIVNFPTGITVTSCTVVQNFPCLVGGQGPNTAWVRDMNDYSGVLDIQIGSTPLAPCDAVLGGSVDYSSASNFQVLLLQNLNNCNPNGGPPPPPVPTLLPTFGGPPSFLPSDPEAERRKIAIRIFISLGGRLREPAARRVTEYPATLTITFAPVRVGKSVVRLDRAHTAFKISAGKSTKVLVTLSRRDTTLIRAKPIKHVTLTVALTVQGPGGPVSTTKVYRGISTHR